MCVCLCCVCVCVFVCLCRSVSFCVSQGYSLQFNEVLLDTKHLLNTKQKV